MEIDRFPDTRKMTWAALESEVRQLRALVRKWSCPTCGGTGVFGVDGELDAECEECEGTGRRRVGDE
jgi:DnaJ-class molecular chaperone